MTSLQSPHANTPTSDDAMALQLDPAATACIHSSSYQATLASPYISDTSSPSSSSAVFCRVQPLDMTGEDASLRTLSPAEAVQLVIRAAAKKQQLKQQQQQATAKPRRIRKDNSARAKRYRAKKQSQLDSTLAQVETLQSHIRELRTLRQILSEKAVMTPFATTGSPLRFVHEYFEVFRYGMHKPPAERKSGALPNRAICGDKQVRFMLAFTQPDVQFGEAVGVMPAMDQWRMYSSLHPTLFLEFVSFRMDTIANCVLVTTTGVLHMRYTRAAVVTLFPHAVARESVVAKLVGAELHLRYSDQWYFDEQGKVTRYELIPDMVQALYDIVGNLEDVAWLLTGGAVIPDTAHFTPETAARIEELDDAAFVDHGDIDCSEESSVPCQSSSTSSPPPAAMAIDFLLS